MFVCNTVFQHSVLCFAVWILAWEPEKSCKLMFHCSVDKVWLHTKRFLPGTTALFIAQCCVICFVAVIGHRPCVQRQFALHLVVDALWKSKMKRGSRLITVCNWYVGARLFGSISFNAYLFLINTYLVFLCMCTTTERHTILTDHCLSLLPVCAWIHCVSTTSPLFSESLHGDPDNWHLMKPHGCLGPPRYPDTSVKLKPPSLLSYDHLIKSGHKFHLNTGSELKWIRFWFSLSVYLNVIFKGIFFCLFLPHIRFNVRFTLHVVGNDLLCTVHKEVGRAWAAIYFSGALGRLAPQALPVFFV